MQRDKAQYEEFAQREAHFEKAQREARFANFVARDAESVAAIRRLSAEERKDSFARYWSTRQQASGPGRCEIGPSCARELRQAELKASMDLAASDAMQRFRLGELRSKVAGEFLSKVAAIRRFYGVV